VSDSVLLRNVGPFVANMVATGIGITVFIFTGGTSWRCQPAIHDALRKCV